MPSPLWIEDGLALCEIGREDTFTEFAGRVAEARPIFIRHLAPVQSTVELTSSEGDIEILAEAVESLTDRIDPDQTFAVQARFLSELTRPYRKFTVNEALSARVTARTGAMLDCKSPAQVVSVLCTPERGYLGVSRTELNRSAWPGGEHRFKRDEGQISRAEFKLLEALDVFALSFSISQFGSSGGKALDLGAAPGGWTRVLRQMGMRVVAVDPADLDARFRRDPSVTHVATTIEAFMPTVKTQFDLITNDMRMDADLSVEEMLRASRVLLPGRPALMTLKLPDPTPHPKSGTAGRAGRERYSDLLARVRLALERLSRDYEILGCRQLFHNRSEVTVAMLRK